MGGREIERKLVADSSRLSFFEAECLISSYIASQYDLELTRDEEDGSLDIYWYVKAPERTFVRLRILNKEIVQLTVKKEDKTGALNRVEVDIEIDIKSLPNVIQFNNTLFGPEIGRVDKHYTVFWLNHSRDHTISCYQVRVDEDAKPFTFIEVEGTNEAWVNEHSNNLKKLSKDLLHDAAGSLYTLFLEKSNESETIYSPI